MRPSIVATSLAATIALAGCDRLPEPIRRLIEPTPKAAAANDPVRITLRGNTLTLGCVRAESGTCHFLLISRDPNRIEAFKVTQGQGQDIERVGREAFYCMDAQRTPDVEKCERKKLWAELEPADK